MKPVLAVLGGSSPFTASLIDALAKTYIGRMPLPPMELVLNGRSQDSLSLILRYAIHRLTIYGWSCRAEHEMERALDGANLVIHQIRYGGLAQRVAGERFCSAFRLQDDETLGPAALLNGIHSLPSLEITIAALKRYCPGAFVLNLTNPLSAFTAIMAQELRFCVGLCELPVYTLGQAAVLLGLPETVLEWQYFGLNHRGFILNIRYGGNDLLRELAKRLTEGTSSGLSPTTIGGIGPDCISRLGALPLKYFRLLSCGQANTSSRASFLLDLSLRILAELRQNPIRSPDGLRERYMEWYPRAVVPTLAAFTSDIPSVQVVNVLRSDGLVWELKAPVSKVGIGYPEPASINPVVGGWLDRFATHEHAFLRAVCTPNRTNLRSAVIADPLIPKKHADEVVKAIEAELKSPKAVRDV